MEDVVQKEKKGTHDTTAGDHTEGATVCDDESMSGSDEDPLGGSILASFIPRDKKEVKPETLRKVSTTPGSKDKQTR